MPGLLPIATIVTTIAQLEWPQEVVGLLSEVWPHSEDFMNKVLHTDDATIAWPFSANTSSITELKISLGPPSLSLLCCKHNSEKCI